MKNFIEEFKKFAIKGNVMDMAVGLVVGSAFTSIVNSLVNDIIMPLVALLCGNIAFDSLKLVLKGAGENAITLNYGSFIQYVVNFLIVAFVLFTIIKAINKLKEEPEPEEEKEPEPSDELKALNRIAELLEKK